MRYHSYFLPLVVLYSFHRPLPRLSIMKGENDMLSNDELIRIRNVAARTIDSHFRRLNDPNESIDLGSIITKAITEAIKEYDSIRTQ